jgi:hypothetical protein
LSTRQDVSRETSECVARKRSMKALTAPTWPDRQGLRALGSAADASFAKIVRRVLIRPTRRRFKSGTLVGTPVCLFRPNALPLGFSRQSRLFLPGPTWCRVQRARLSFARIHAPRLFYDKSRRFSVGGASFVERPPRRYSAPPAFFWPRGGLSVDGDLMKGRRRRCRSPAAQAFSEARPLARLF